ncbi:polysaccharide pyruvyl transferase family protein [Polaribacter sp. NJDZ03]|uniref:polysaccharide pyruvyl transferase family protein n=1 Tax=Polaribacter sp. NJDZ03 TaxID=2855841 RepID=UPI001C49D1D3|nr:polysaccharide pyruvyl transferase family protein [Polaribacter sp. NJDZ03]
MKKIGVLTLPLKGNYGGVLQAFALTTFLKENGFDAYLVDRQWNQTQKNLKYYIQKIIYHNLLIGKVKKFNKKWINPKTFEIRSQERMLDLNNEGFDAFVVGSDQVWRVEHTGGVKNNYFLDFIKDKNVKKVAYAASFGKDSVDGTEESLNEISSLLKQFNAISVREESGVKICSETFDVKAAHVLDPVLLLNSDDYLPIIDKSSPKLVNTMTTYVLDASKVNNDIISDAAAALNLEAVSINYKKDPGLLLKNKSLDFYNYIYPSVSNWLRGFRDAEFIITDSFHGTIFSILFKKQFLVIGNERRGLARFNSILSKLGLMDRLITSKNPYNKEMLFKKINFNEVQELLNKEKVASKSFLLSALK